MRGYLEHFTGTYMETLVLDPKVGTRGTKLELQPSRGHSAASVFIAVETAKSLVTAFLSDAEVDDLITYLCYIKAKRIEYRLYDPKMKMEGDEE